MNTKISLSKFLLGTYFVFQTTIAGVAYATERPLTGSDVSQQSTDEVAHQRSNSSQKNTILPRYNTESSSSKQNQSNTMLAAAACNDNAFITSGSALLNQIKTQSFDCVGRLFNASTSVKNGTFTQNNIITVANEARSQSQSYNGSDADKYVRSLYYWIRAFYFIKGNDGTNATNQAAVQSAIEALFNNGSIWTNNEDSGDVLRHAGVDLLNARIGHRFVPQLKNFIDRFNQSYQSTTNWGNAFAAVSWNVLSDCAYTPSCRAAEHNSALALKISNFIHNNIAWLDKPANSYHLHNLGYQLANLYSSKNDSHFSSMKNTLDTQLNRIFNNFGYNKGDTGRVAYMLALSGVENNNVCATFNLCNKKEQIIADVLDDRITCPSGTLFMWAQDMTQAQLEWACNSLGAHESHFHSKLQTNNTPVTPDDNDKLRMIVFNNSDEWSTYGGALFNASTNNGGLYLEGDPSKPGDQATFFAYEEVPARPIFDIWNLRHEYVHYLEGRFISKGDFGDSNGAGRTVWWGEGIAEYISLKDCNPGAVQAAGNGTYDASTIFNNEYGVGQDRIYDWGYLTTRYMFEKQNSTLFQMMDLFKQGKFQDYRTNMVDNWVSNKTFDSSFDSWLTTVQSTGCTVDNTRPPSPVEPINVDDVQGTDQPGVNACGAGNSDDPKAGVAQCLVNKSGGARESLAIFVPSGLVNVTMEVTLRHGSGTANLKHRHDSWPTDTVYDYQTTGSGTNKTMLVNPVKQGWNYFYVNAEQSFSNVTFLARYIQNGGTGNNVPPTAQAGGPYSGTVGSGISFSSNGSTDSDGSISSYNWNFGDGSSSTSANPNHSYTSAGTFTATLTVTDNDGATDTDTASVTVSTVGGGNQLQNGVAKSGLAATAGNDVVYYIDVPSGATNLVIKTSGDGDADLYTRFNAEPTDNDYKCRPYAGGSTETCTEASPTAGRWYARVKAYQAFTNVTLTASYDTSPGGGNVAPTANAGGPYSGIVGTGIAFNSNGSTDSDGNISSYSWNFGDGSSSTSPNPNHRYTSAGTFTATLTVTDNDGATDTDTATVTITAAGGGNQLQNGVAKSGLAATAGNDVIYYIDVPSGATNLVIKISGDGDADLYTRFNVAPTDNDYKCRPWVNGSAETCTEASPTAGRWYARVKAYQAFTNVTLTATYN